ncbi:tetratricopeptide repeat protein [Brucella sp. BE17]|uniref:tetratricopeptide repeat protein n=1 Tax=Brucella sp. BE17 TaxID=3142977 RepID=UPI0031BBC4BA
MRLRSVGVLVLWVALMMFGSAHAQDAGRALKQLQEIHAIVMDPGQTFSISGLLSELDNLEPAVKKTPENSRERGELAYLRGFIEYRAGRPKDSIGPMQDASRIDEAAPFLKPKERWRNYYNIATQAQDLQDWSLAIQNYEKAIPLLDADPEMTSDQKLGARQDWAYVLHEAQRYQDARKLNEYLLAEGEKLHGTDSYKLITVVINLAQNSYDLKDFTAARSYLDKYLRIATANDDAENTENALFQLGVLAFEMGNKVEAEGFMKRRLELATASGDSFRISEAQDALDALYVKAGKQPN